MHSTSACHMAWLRDFRVLSNEVNSNLEPRDESRARNALVASVAMAIKSPIWGIMMMAWPYVQAMHRKQRGRPNWTVENTLFCSAAAHWSHRNSFNFQDNRRGAH